MRQKIRQLLAGMCIFRVLAASAASLTTTGGQLYHNVEIQRIAGGKVTINHDGGKAVLSLDDLPENFVAAMSTRQRYALQSQVDLVLNDGRKLERTNIMEIGDGKVTLACVAGVLEIPENLLPKSYLVTFTPLQVKAIARKQKTTATTLHTTTDAKVMPPAVNGNPPSPDEAPVATEVDAKGRTVYTGPRGGRYYLSPEGKKVYLPKKKN